MKRAADGEPKVGAAELLARIRRRREQANSRPNPYLQSGGQSRQYPQPRTTALQFHDKGEFEAQADLQRTESAYEDCLVYLPSEAPPESEWWDSLANEAGGVSNKVLHPVEVDPPFPTEGDGHVFLTTKELRRKRKLARAQRLKDSQDRIRLGLDPPPPPKLRLANMVAVFGPEYLRDPTRYEKLARDAEAQRRHEHEAANRARMLTPQQRWAKREASILRHKAQQGIHCSVFSIEGVRSAKLQYVIDYAAKKFLLTGCALWSPPLLVGIVIIEGGAPEIRKFTKLMLAKLKRIDPGDQTDDHSPTNTDAIRCRLVWSGIERGARFKRWSAHSFPTGNIAKQFLAEHDCLAYWKLATSSAIRH